MRRETERTSETSKAHRDPLGYETDTDDNTSTKHLHRMRIRLSTQQKALKNNEQQGKQICHEINKLDQRILERNPEDG